MNRIRLAVALVLVLPAAGCVFAVGADEKENEELRDRVRDLEHRLDRLEGGHGESYGRPRRSSEFLPVPPRAPVPPAPPAPPAPPPPPDRPQPPAGGPK